jgi:hypothetical protein
LRWGVRNSASAGYEGLRQEVKIETSAVVGEYFRTPVRLNYRPKLSPYPRHRGPNVLASVSFVS